MLKLLRKTRGSALTTTIIALAVLSVVGISIVSLMITNMRQAGALRDFEALYYEAESAVTHGIDAVRTASVHVYNDFLLSPGTENRYVRGDRYGPEFYDLVTETASRWLEAGGIGGVSFKFDWRSGSVTVTARAGDDDVYRLAESSITLSARPIIRSAGDIPWSGYALLTPGEMATNIGAMSRDRVSVSGDIMGGLVSDRYTLSSGGYFDYGYDDTLVPLDWYVDVAGIVSSVGAGLEYSDEAENGERSVGKKRDYSGGDFYFSSRNPEVSYVTFSACRLYFENGAKFQKSARLVNCDIYITLSSGSAAAEIANEATLSGCRIFIDGDLLEIGSTKLTSAPRVHMSDSMIFTNGQIVINSAPLGSDSSSVFLYSSYSGGGVAIRLSASLQDSSNTVSLVAYAEGAIKTEHAYRIRGQLVSKTGIELDRGGLLDNVSIRVSYSPEAVDSFYSSLPEFLPDESLPIYLESGYGKRFLPPLSQMVDDSMSGRIREVS